MLFTMNSVVHRTCSCQFYMKLECTSHYDAWWLVVICSQSKRFWLDTEWERLMQWLMIGPPMSCFGPQAPTSRWWLLRSQTNLGETLWQDWGIQKELQYIPVLGECSDGPEINMWELEGTVIISQLYFIYFFIFSLKGELSCCKWIRDGFFFTFQPHKKNKLTYSVISNVTPQLLILVWLVPPSGHYARLYWWQQCCSSCQHNSGLALWTCSWLHVRCCLCFTS